MRKLKHISSIALLMIGLIIGANAQLNFDVLGSGVVSNSAKVGGNFYDTVSFASGVRFDECSFINKVVPGNSFVSVKVMDPDVGNNNSESGLMIRDGLANGAPYLAVTVNGNRYLKIRQRWYPGGAEVVRGVGTVIRKNQKFWLKLERIQSTDPNFAVYGVYIKYRKNEVWQYIDRGSFTNISSYNAGIVSASGFNWPIPSEFHYKQLKFGTSLARMPEVITENAVFPNPTRNAFVVHSVFPFNKIEVFNLEGKTVAGKEIQEATNKSSMDISNLSSGIYIVRIRGAEGTKTFRLQKIE